jgi:hypothetical protein
MGFDALLLLTLLGQFVYLKRQVLLERPLRKTIVSLLRDEAGVSVDIKSLEGSYVSHLVLHDIVLHGLSDVPEVRELRLGTLTLRYNPFSLASGNLSGLHSVSVEKVYVELDLDAGLAERREKASEGEKPFPHLSAIPLPAIRARDVTVKIISQGRVLTFHRVSIDSAGGTLGDAMAQLAWDDARFTHNGKGLYQGKGSATLKTSDGECEVNLFDDDRKVLRAWLTWPGPDSSDLTLKARVDLGDTGRVKVEGSLHWPPGTGFRAELQGEALDLARLTSFLPPYRSQALGQVNLTASLAGPDWNPKRFHGKWTLNLAKAAAEGFTLTRLEASGELATGLDAKAKAAIESKKSIVLVEAAAQWNGPLALTVSADHAKLSDFSPRLPDFFTTGVVSFTGRCQNLDGPWRLRGRLDSSFKTLATFEDLDFTADLTMNAVGLYVRKGEARAPGATASVNGKVSWRKKPGFTFDAYVDCLSLAALFPQIPLDLDGVVSVDASLTLRHDQLHGRAEVKAPRLTLEGQLVEALRAGLVFKKDILLANHFSAHVAGVDVELDGADLSWDPEGVNVGGRGLRLSWREGDLKSQTPLTLRVQSDRVEISPLVMTGSAGRLAGRFTWSVEGLDARADIQCQGLERLPEDLFGGEAPVKGPFHIEAVLAGTPEKPCITLTARGEALRVGDLPAMTCRIEAGLRDGTAFLTKAVVSGEAGYIRAVGHVPFDLRLTEDFDPMATLQDLPDEEGWNLRVSGRVRELGDLFGPASGVDLHGRVSFDLGLVGSLTTPAVSGRITALRVGPRAFPLPKVRLTFEPDPLGVRITRGSLRLGFAEMSLKGLVPLRFFPSPEERERGGFDPFRGPGRFDITLRCDELEIEDIPKTFALPEVLAGMKGRGRVRLRLTGDWTSPQIIVDGAVTEFGLPILAEDVGATFGIGYTDGLLTISDIVISAGKGKVHANGRFPLSLDMDSLRSNRVVAQEDEIFFKARLEDLDPGIILPAVPEFKTLAGTISGRLHLDGTYKKPRHNVRVRVEDCSLSLKSRALPRIDGLQGDITLTPEKLVFEVNGSSSGGKVSATSLVTFRHGEVESIRMDARGRNRPLVLAGPPARIRADFDLRLRGRPGDAVCSGEVNVLRTRIRQRIDLGRTSSGSPGFIPSFKLPGIDRLRLDIRVRTPEGIKIFSEIHQAGLTVADLRAEIDCKLRIVGTSETPILTGVVRSVDGSADLPFYRLDLVSAQAQFFERNPTNPQINILGKTTKVDHTIFVAVNGTLDNPSINFHSDPPMPEEDIKVFLATGVRAQDWQGRQAGETLGLQLLTLLAKQVTPFIFGKSEGDSIFDRISVSSERGEEGGTTYKARFRLLDWLWLAGEKEGRRGYRGGVIVKFGFKSK